MLFTHIQPMLLEMSPEPFDSKRHIFEPKADGFRILIHKENRRIEAYTRHGTCVTSKFPELIRIVDLIEAEDVILDTEGTCFWENRFHFEAFSRRSRLVNSFKIERATETNPATFFAFDILMKDRENLTKKSLMERKEILQNAVRKGIGISLVPHVEARGKTLFEQTKMLGWEGIVAKKRDSVYVHKRSEDWLKIKHWKSMKTVILGYRREPTFALIVGIDAGEKKFAPVAAVELGMKAEEKMAFVNAAREIHTTRDKDVQWIEPRLCAQVKYLERTARGSLRMPVFQRFILSSTT